MNKKGLYYIAIVIALIFGYRMYENRVTIIIYDGGHDCLHYHGYAPSDVYWCGDLWNVTTTSYDSSRAYGLRSSTEVRGIDDKLLSKYTINDYIILSGDDGIYIYNYVKKAKKILPDELQELEEDVFKTAMVVASDTELCGILVDLEGTKHYSYYSFADYKFTYLDKSVDGVISYNVNPLILIDGRYLIINVIDYENDDEYTLIFDTAVYQVIHKLDFVYYGEEISLLYKLFTGYAFRSDPTSELVIEPYN